MKPYPIFIRAINVDIPGFHSYVREKTGKDPASCPVVELSSNEAPDHVLKNMERHGAPLHFIVPCHRHPERHAVAVYGDGYCERVGGFSCGYGGAGPLALGFLVAKLRGLDRFDETLYILYTLGFANEAHRNSIIELVINSKDNIELYILHQYTRQ